MITTIAKYFLILAAWTMVYEALRYFGLRRLRLALRRSVQGFIERHQVQIARFQFANKLLVRQTLLNDPEICRAMLDHATANHLPPEEARDAVELYIEEIVPSFNLVSYYKLGYPLARLFVNSLYTPIVDRSQIPPSEEPGSETGVIFVLNHRSNVDFILASYVLSEKVALSYAVGEWARVWPLDELFKSFGSYFVRRNFREPLYHLVLEKYVQLLTRKSGKQAIFLEGGLSRDGCFREPKIGLLDYILKVRRDPTFHKDLVFVPAAINYDRVLEDTYLLREQLGRGEDKGLVARLTSLGRVLGHVGKSWAANFVRYFTGAVKRHGYACVCFGKPVSLSAYLAERQVALESLDEEQRKLAVKQFAQHLMEHVGRVLPVTPVCLVAEAFLSSGQQRLTKLELVRRVGRLREFLLARGAHVVSGQEFEPVTQGRATHAEEKALYDDSIYDVIDQLFASEVAQQTVDSGLEVLAPRKLIREDRDGWVLDGQAREILRYYANSIRHLVPATPPAAEPRP